MKRKGIAMEVSSIALEALEGLMLDTILSKLDPASVASLASTSTRLRSAASDEALWRRFCASDLDVQEPRDPDGTPCPSFKAAYKTWYKSFGMYPLPLVKRAKQCLDSIKSWMAANFPEAGYTLRKGASEAEIKQAEAVLGVEMPISMKVLYRLCDGQETVAQSISDLERLAPLGIIGGYEFYDFEVNVHLLPLRKIVTDTRQVARKNRELARHLGFTPRSKYIIVAASFYLEKLFFLDCSSGQLYVGTKNLTVDGEMMPCVPQALVQQDALLLWLEEHSRRLQSGMIRTRGIRKYRSISLFPEAPPSCSVAVTNGVQVRASAVFVPELSNLSGAEDKYFFSYSIRMSLLPEGCMLDGTYHSSCQLLTRHWNIKSEDVVISNVHGEAVIGKFPLLFPGKEEFVYQSCTPLPGARGSVEGSFTFVPGRLRKPDGRHFRVEVAPFPLEAPDYIF